MRSCGDSPVGSGAASTLRWRSPATQNSSSSTSPPPGSTPRHLRTLGTTVVLTTHYLDEAEHLADRVAILQDGHIRACGTSAELARQAGAEPRMEMVQPSLEEVYLHLVGTAEGMS
jgi:hypothetical protein